MTTHVNYVLTATFLGFALPAGAADFLVNSANEVAASLQQAGPGDSIVLANGTWTNQYIRFNDHGSAANPITLRPETPGGVILTGTSRLDISGSHLVVDGLRFENGALSADQHIVRFTGTLGDATDSRLTNTTIADYNPPDINTRYFWVSLYGTDNIVDHNRFEGQNHSGVTVTVWRDSNAADRHLIDANHFLDRPVGNGNGFETIRLGTSDNSLSDSSTVIQNNLFERTNGEAEIISVKAGDNDIRYNTFLEASGTLTLRHGNGNRVEGNFFLGNNASGTGGVRVIGEDHVVTNNYLADLDGRSNGGIVLTGGVPNSALNEYYQVKNAVVAHNTIVNITDAGIKLDDGIGSSGRTLLPENVALLNNLIVNAAPSFEGAEGVGFTWGGNLAFGGSLGIPARPGVTVADPMLVLGADGLYRPAAGSPAIDNAAANAFVTLDMDGQERTGVFDIGADEASAAQIVRRPLTAADVGPGSGVVVDPPTGSSILKLQAEDFAFVTDPNGDGDTWSIVSVGDALGGAAIQAPPGPRVDLATDTHDALALYNMSFGQGGGFTVYYRARGFGSSTDSFFAPDGFGTDPDITTTATADGAWRWETGEVFTIDAANVGMPLQLRLGRREQTTQLDAIVFALDGGLTATQLDALFVMLAGDYNGNGQVEQGDLDLVLLNWGVDTGAAGVPAGWINDPPTGLIDQQELDGVLLNWGSAAEPDLRGASIPEPMCGAAVLAVCLTRRSAGGARPACAAGEVPR